MCRHSLPLSAWITMGLAHLHGTSTFNSVDVLIRCQLLVLLRDNMIHQSQCTLWLQVMARYFGHAVLLLHCIFPRLHAHSGTLVAIVGMDHNETYTFARAAQGQHDTSIPVYLVAAGHSRCFGHAVLLLFSRDRTHTLVPQYHGFIRSSHCAVSVFEVHFGILGAFEHGLPRLHGTTGKYGKYGRIRANTVEYRQIRSNTGKYRALRRPGRNTCEYVQRPSNT
ncbi:hypothetical protein B0H14DRAFT_2628858 [Mycena olivaceomarginata]|nr:hypothetical protein B0H14DRAFT_2628858 [Mycena olivaceomarginata]